MADPGRFSDVRGSAGDWGISPPHLMWDFIQDVWVKGSPPGTGYVRSSGGGPGVWNEVATDSLNVRTPLLVDASRYLMVNLAEQLAALDVNIVGGAFQEVAVDPGLIREPLNLDALGNLRVAIAGGVGPGLSEIAVLLSDGVTRVPALIDDASGALLVTIAGPTGTPLYIPIGGIAPNDYVQTFEMAPSSAMYRAVLPVLGDGDAVLASCDQNGRLILSPSAGFPPGIEAEVVNFTGGSLYYGETSSVVPGPFSVIVQRPVGTNGFILEGVLLHARPTGANQIVNIHIGNASYTWLLDNDPDFPDGGSYFWQPETPLTCGENDYVRVDMNSTCDIKIMGRNI